MTSKRQRQAGYLLPEPQTGYPLVCVQLMIPDHPRYRAALQGQLKALGDWWTWEKSFQPGDVRASTAAQLWRELLHEYLTIGECGMADFDVRQNEETPCVLEKTSDGATWEPWADLQLCPPKIRSLAGRLFYSTNGGATWEPVEDATYEEYDWRDDEVLFPPRAGDDKRCLAAANAVAVFVELHAEIVAWYETEANALKLGMAIMGVVALLFPASAPWIAGSIAGSGLALGILQYAVALNNPAFTQGIRDQLRCIFWTWADSDGRWSASAFASVIADVQAKTGDMWRLLELYLGEIGGHVGLNNAGTTTSIATADCADCEDEGWCYEWDFTQSQQGWAGDYGTSWDSGWHDNNNPQYDGVYIWRSGLPAMTITRFELDFYPDGWNGNNAQIFIANEHPPANYDIIATGTADFTKIIEGEVVVTDTLYIAADRWVGGMQFFGAKRLTAIRIYGDGTNPFGQDNCV